MFNMWFHGIFKKFSKFELLQIDTSNPFLTVTIMFVRFPRKISKWNVKVYSHLWLEIRLVHPFVVDEYLRSNLTSWLEFWPLNLVLRLRLSLFQMITRCYTISSLDSRWFSTTRKSDVLRDFAPSLLLLP